ncbi:MAG TPA: cob(I)yrinic acid a,c-diamide adenosyltransferase [Nevskiaceae bacterium]|nr:cob(I)yrinic acid a,c-diamide adenosyltransferase [Nevskiaceae bacterium]
MGHRLSSIVTRTGDAGTTGLTGGGRVPKAHARVQAMGEVDELNCVVGALLAHRMAPGHAAMLLRIQHELFNLGGELSMPGHTLVGADEVARLEDEIEVINAKLPPLKEFVLPGGNAPAAAAHLARAVARRAERALWTLHAIEPVGECALRYANRLSDLMFVFARTLARARGGQEVTWNSRKAGATSSPRRRGSGSQIISSAKSQRQKKKPR